MIFRLTIPAALILAHAVSPFVVAAADLPAFDHRAYCAGVGQQMGGSKQIELICVKEEVAAISSLQASPLDARIVQYCEGIGEMMGGSYQFMRICVDEEVAARDALATRTVAAETNAYCDGVADMMGGSWQFKLICVDEEEAAARALAAQ